MRFLSLFLSLAVFWGLNSGRVDPGYDHYLMGVGIACALFATWIALRMGAVDEEGHPVIFALRLWRYLPWLVWQILLSNIDVARRVWSPRSRIAPHLVRIPYTLRSGFGITTYANSITLTPGTVTLSVDDDSMLIHALHEGAAEDLQTGAMHDRIKVLEA